MKNPKLKKIRDQVIVITGASSGIGLATARMAASKGARLVLSSRNEESLRQICEDIRSKGGEAAYVVADVGDPHAVERIAQAAIERFGGFDTWVNNAGLSLYGRVFDHHLDEKRKLFDTNFWGVVHGCRAAVPHLRTRGGAIINMGSIESERAVPLHAIYSASKHAVKAYTDSLRMEIEHESWPISVSLIKPASIGTPFIEHSRNRMEQKAEYPAPVYAPEVVARAVLDCATHPHRDVLVGGSAKVFSLMEKFAPRLTDLWMERSMYRMQKQDAPKPWRDTLEYPETSLEGEERGGTQHRIKSSSAYTSASLHPVKAGLIASGIAGVAYGLLSLRKAA